MENKKNEINKDIDQVSGGSEPPKLSDSSRDRERFGIPYGAAGRGYLGVATRDPQTLRNLGGTTKDISEEAKYRMKKVEEFAKFLHEHPELKKDAIEYLGL